tara:strand:+ start:1279 stop:1521 length:243 start_codon:yes stop_codon:yes gene_type:complete
MKQISKRGLIYLVFLVVLISLISGVTLFKEVKVLRSKLAIAEGNSGFVDSSNRIEPGSGSSGAVGTLKAEVVMPKNERDG